MKKIYLFLLVGLVAGCTSTPAPEIFSGEYNEDGEPIPEWAIKVGAIHEQHMAEKKKEMEEYNKLLAQQPAKKPSETPDTCKINGHNCWDVVQKLGKTKEIRTENPDKTNIWAPDIVTYENPDLKAWGLTVTFYTMYRDGGSTDYVLNDNISIHTNRSLGMQGTPAYGQTTIKFKETGKQFIYDFTGKLIGNDSPFPD